MQDKNEVTLWAPSLTAPVGLAFQASPFSAQDDIPRRLPGILSDREIGDLCAPGVQHPMLSPYVDASVRTEKDDSIDKDRRVLSYGVSSYGYDVRLAEEIKLFSNLNSRIIDPKHFDEACLVDGEVLMDDEGSRYAILPPNSYLLGRTVEYFCMPRDVTALFIAKSTMARAGISVNCTPAECGWEGNLVLEIANLTNLPAKIYVGEGIAQALFFRGATPCRTSYADRGGKYQGQTGITLPKA